MAEVTGIEWTSSTWNPWTGCTKISPGCANCYMYTEKAMYGQDPAKIVRSKTTFSDPLKWQRRFETKGIPVPKFCFTCSWSDFFIAQADEWRPEAWATIKQTPGIIYQILTKRIERVPECLPADWPYPNVWLGVSVENQRYADARIHLLAQVPAAVRWISAEPLLGPIDVRSACQLRPKHLYGERPLDWVVVGGESGPGARPMDLAWASAIRLQCQQAAVPFFMKQVCKAGQKIPFEQFPVDLQVREYPKEAA